MKDANKDPDDLAARLAAEQEARRTAEALLAQRSRDLDDMSQRLLAETEALRNALSVTEALRHSEAAALKDRSILSEALKALTAQAGADEALQTLLQVLLREFPARQSFFLRADGTRTVIAASAQPDFVGRDLPVPPSVMARSRRIAALRSLVVAGAEWPGDLPGDTPALIVPMPLNGDDGAALLLVFDDVADLTATRQRTLEQVAGFAVQALRALREARRNALLVGLVEGRPLDRAESILDTPFEAIYGAFARLTEMQGEVVGILDALLGAPLHDTDIAIDDALARIGHLSATDRVYVFRLRPEGDFIDNTHEWCARGIEPMREMLQAIPATMIDHWRAVFDAGEPVVIPDVDALPDSAPEKETLQVQGIRSMLAVPMVSDGRFHGFVGFDAVRAPRNFLPGEVYMIRSVAKVIVSILARRDAVTLLAQAHAETVVQRRRLEAVLAAMPDLIVELDAEGRFTSWHSGAIAVPDPVYDFFVHRTPEETLPPDLAAVARAKLQELDAGARSISHTFSLALLGPEPRWWQVTGTAQGDAGYIFALRDITELREQSSEIERLSKIARRTTNLVVITDAKRRIEWVNAAFERTTGWTLDEVRGKNPGQILHCDQTDPATVARFRAALDAGLPVQGEILNQSRSGERYWLSIDIQPVHDEAGTLEGFMAVQVDITEQRRQADALRRAAQEAATARATLETAVEALQDGFALYDSDDRLVICNSRYREIYAASAPAIVPGARFEDILRYGIAQGQYSEAEGREEDWVSRRLALHECSESEVEQRLADGTWLRVYEKATPDGGRVGLRIDITELKLAEQRAIADRATAMEASQDGIAITDGEGCYTYMNRAHLDLFGFRSEAEVLGRHWSILYGPEETAWLTAHAMPVLMRDGGWSGEIMGLARDGRSVDQDVSMTLKDDGGFLIITRDMTQRRQERAERERLEHELQLAQRREMIGQMAAGLAHDFNNLLAVIAGGASLIRETARDGDSAAIGATRILAASDQAAGLVRRLLALGARQPSRVPLDLRQPVREAAELVRSSLRAPMRLFLSLPDDAIEALADPTDILQVILNLAINARDALADRPGSIAINLTGPDHPAASGVMTVGRLDPHRRYACLSVVDTGPGMPAHIAARILDPYFSTKGEKGTGLGLAIVSSVIADNGGALRLETAPGQGTRFDVFWPTDARLPDARPVQPLPGALTGRLDGRTILVLDDQQEVLDVLTAYFEAAGAEVAPSTDPGDILDALRDDPAAWDLLVTDYDMPQVTGAELARTARGLAPRLPVLLVTALVGEAGRNSEDFAAVLPKPVDRDALLSTAELVILAATDGEG
ncbi:PAS domain S-box protein [Roseicyclus marinus]|uniref:PAS domain S-box protein n=1 Tax=Roseicyclus marinus TaxID=2161673 RepID=UPI00240F65A1|nr:PAS domain S-box protein [Roseicyclus marinus]MDG3042994.1 PAS domain S-box protein [Roseicyclus marinus]